MNLNVFLLIYAGLKRLSEPLENMHLYLCLPLLVILLQPAQCVYNCSSEYDRTPGMCNQPAHCNEPVHRISKFPFSFFCFLDNSDLTVDCGTTVITLEVNLCSAMWAGFNATDLALNGNHNISDCLGSVDISVNPPVIRYQLPVNHSQDNSCRQSLQVREGQGETPKHHNSEDKQVLQTSVFLFSLIQIVDEAPDSTGPFSSFLTIQSVIITGYIDTPRSDQGLISYSTDLHYHFSCRYPLEYLINNTQIVAWVSQNFGQCCEKEKFCWICLANLTVSSLFSSSVSVATSDSNGTFIDTLKMAVFNVSFGR